MRAVGPGVREIRVSVPDGAYRVLYVTNIGDAPYVLHAFKKTTQQTEQRDIDLAKSRLNDLKERLRQEQRDAKRSKSKAH